MPITPMAVDDPLTASKMNEIIAAINGIEISRINFNGGDLSIRGMAGNIGGVSRPNGLPGNYRISFASPRVNANYAVVSSCSTNFGNDTGFVTLLTLTTTYVDIYCRNDDGGANDCEIVTVMIVGD